MNCKMIVGSLFFSFLLLFSYMANAQQPDPNVQEVPKVEVSDKELSNFVSAVKEVQKIQETTEKKMVKEITDEGLDPNRFMQIAQYKQNPGSYSGDEVSEEELKSFDKAKEKVEGIRKDAEDESKNAIENEGMDIQRYIQIAQAVQQDPALQKRIQELLLKE